MEGLNKCMFIGNLGQDPELRTTPGGQTVLELRLAATESYKDRNGVRQEKTEWVSANVWGARAEALSKILNKGERIYIEGRLETTSSEKDGVKRYFTRVNAQNVILLGSRKPQQSATDHHNEPTDDVPGAIGDDEIPF